MKYEDLLNICNQTLISDSEESYKRIALSLINKCFLIKKNFQNLLNALLSVGKETIDFDQLELSLLSLRDSIDEAVAININSTISSTS